MNSLPNNNSGLNRRRFIKAAGLSIPLITLGSQSGWAAERITLEHPSAGPLGYVHDAATVDTVKFPKRAGEAGAKQLCSNCSQYKETEAGWGTCTIFPGFLVAGPGWCNVWVE